MYHRNVMRDHLSIMPKGARKRTTPEPNAAYDFKCFARVEAERALRTQRWREVYDLMMPDREAFKEPRQAGQTSQKPVDSYPGHALQRGCGNVISALFPPERVWFEILAGRGIPEDQAEDVNEAAEAIRDIVFDEISRSNFAAALQAMMRDVFVCLGGMRVERGKDKDNPLQIRCVPLKELYPVTGPDGGITGMMRKYELEVGELESELSADGTRRVNIPEELRDKITTDPKHKVCLLECSRTLDDGRQRITCYLWDSKHVLMDHVGSDNEEPSAWIATPWSPSPESAYGTDGPAMRAIYDARMLNHVKETEAKAMDLRLDPPRFVNIDAGINPHTLTMAPRTFVPFSSNLSGGQPPFYAIPDGGNIQYTQVKVEDLRASLAEQLFASPTLPPVEDSHSMTYGEVRVRWMQKLREEGVDFGTFNRAFGFGFIRRCVWVLRSWNVVPQILKINGKLFKIRYAGPLANAKDDEDASNILTFVADIVGTIGEEAAHDGIRMEDVPSIVGQKRNVPQALLRTEEERQQRQEIKAQAMAAQAELAMQQGQQPAA